MYASPYNDGTLLSVWIQPRASKTKIVGLHGNNIKIAVKSPPVDGKANEECIELLSKILGLPKRQVAIKSGQQGRNKSILVKGVSPEKVKTDLENAMKSV
ncbi:MAG: DUF167 domain-containing protein [Firmicutes bacterium]|nr:DUF167 domain-containing protein [Bacillota bacterium]